MSSWTVELKFTQKENVMLGAIILVVLILMLVGAMPNWNHSRTWGYAPSGGLGTILLILVVLMLLGQVRI